MVYYNSSNPQSRPLLERLVVPILVVSCFLGVYVEGFQLQPLSQQQRLSFVPATTTKTKFPRRRIHPQQQNHHRQKQQQHHCLFSLSTLVDEVTTRSSATSQTTTVGEKRQPQTIFVGGKGGVGKTTTSAALAVSLASSYENDLKVLIVSTDPAHSLGDALDEDLKKARGKPIPMTDPMTGGRLWACEVDANEALRTFRDNLAAFDIDRLAQSLGVSTSLLEELGLKEFNGLLKNPPPGLDELVALANVLDNDSVVQEFDIILVDTAPTGHTLRLLALPQFLDGLLGKLIRLRMKLSGLASTLQSFFGNAEEAQARKQAIDNAANKLEEFRTKMSRMRTTLQNADTTRFVVVTVPTKLGIAESKRLVQELNSQHVAVTDIVVNQCVGDLKEIGKTDLENDNALRAYYDRRKSGQDRWIRKIQEVAEDVSASEEYRSNIGVGGAQTTAAAPIAVTKVPFFDVELVGIPALGYVGTQSFAENPAFAHIMDDDAPAAVEEGKKQEPKVTICGGKGGVGKTTTASSLAVSMAAKGHNVAIISTDPAHSLGDALDIDLSKTGGQLVDCPLIGVPSMSATGEVGSLSAMEIDPTSALSQFKGIVDKLVGGGGDGDNDANSGLRNTLRDLEEVFDTLPAGTDEVVALAKIVNLIKQGNYDRIVLDTAPTGHTLRMLSTPGFIAELIDRLLAIAEKINSNAAIRMLVATTAGGARSEELENSVATAKSQLLNFQFQMYDLEDMFADAAMTEFVIVTVATELAARESIRLLNDLTFDAPDMPIKVRNVVINQVLNDGDTDAAKSFISHVGQTQASSIRELERSLQETSATQPIRITKAKYLDTEPRGVFGLKVFADELMREDEQ